MKNLSVLTIFALLVGSFATASGRLNEEKTIMGAKLNYIVPTKPQPGLRAIYLSLNQNESSNKPTSFTLTEDTGVRCVTTPCPSSQKTQFNIIEIAQAIHSDAVMYTAIEVLKNIPPNVRIAPRKLLVTESSMELVAKGGNGFTRRTIWEVQVKTFPNITHYYSAQPRFIQAHPIVLEN